jgi:hypothetical protein
METVKGINSQQFLTQMTKECIMNATLNGKWAYSSFRHAPIVMMNGQVEGNPELALPWAAGGILDVATSESGEVHGTLSFGGRPILKVSGKTFPAANNAPPGVELTGEGLSSVNKIKGYFIPDSDHVVGTILCLVNDPGKQPNGTIGPFVLFPIKA